MPLNDRLIIETTGSSIHVTQFVDIPGCPACCWATDAPMPAWCPEAPAIVTCCRVGPPVIMGCPGWLGATAPGGLHFESPFPNPTAATKALVSVGLNDGLFCRIAAKNKKDKKKQGSGQWSHNQLRTKRSSARLCMHVMQSTDEKWSGIPFFFPWWR